MLSIQCIDTIRLLWWNFCDPTRGSTNTSTYSTSQYNPWYPYRTNNRKTISKRYDMDAFHLFIELHPFPNLGPDITVCENQPVILDAGYNL
ncbi:MAG TPA: hypothetical protein PK028_09060 [Bacteroidales bacterium]|nr:hypothetical protein [Bacteroidales bacterium]MDI9573319.1 hypothetical protein [Bacteroidota bacterium]MBP9512440.1 hypothetical protein [Bacteroidales bacterium]MBP9588919.1 hypothetical protein [Bacteroidales bacterium]HNQ60718.1 hypothetical protein [Bacteroidales bacterium]